MNVWVHTSHFKLGKAKQIRIVSALVYSWRRRFWYRTYIVRIVYVRGESLWIGILFSCFCFCATAPHVKAHISCAVSISAVFPKGVHIEKGICLCGCVFSLTFNGLMVIKSDHHHYNTKIGRRTSQVHCENHRRFLSICFGGRREQNQTSPWAWVELALRRASAW